MSPGHVHYGIECGPVLCSKRPAKDSKLKNYALKQHPEARHSPAHSRHSGKINEPCLPGRDSYMLEQIIAILDLYVGLCLIYPDDPVSVPCDHPVPPPYASEACNYGNKTQ